VSADNHQGPSVITNETKKVQKKD